MLPQLCKLRGNTPEEINDQEKIGVKKNEKYELRSMLSVGEVRTTACGERALLLSLSPCEDVSGCADFCGRGVVQGVF